MRIEKAQKVMKISTVGFFVVACVFAAGCRERERNLQREQQQYDVVKEGSASGTSTGIAAPGETPPTTTTAATSTAMTATNADTTTAFTLPGTTITTGSTQPGTLGSTLPAPGSGNIGGYERPV
ncbi:MAG: hypothetical protein ACXVIJ_05100, partial [Thermoanaerobaculia bacterium]